MNIEYGKTFTFELDGFAFEYLDRDELIQIFRDGRFASPFLEKWLAKKFSALTHITGNKPYDHEDKATGKKYDAKNFTKRGMAFKPSYQKGSSRKYDYEACRQRILDHGLIYIACDIVDFPKVRVRFLDGMQLLNEYKSGNVPFGKRDVIFGTC